MSKEEKEATDIIHKYRMLLMDEGEDYGEEVLVSALSEKMALIHVNGIIGSYNAINEINETEFSHDNLTYIFLDFWNKVKSIIESKRND